MTDCSKESGTCDVCRSACGHKPGWFRPGEAEKTAELLGLTLQELFDHHLGADWYEDYGDYGNVFVLSPAIANMTPGKEFPGEPRGRCVFFEGGQCGIHAAKPFECHEYVHGDRHSDVRVRHEAIAGAWVDQQGQIAELLGEEPHAEPYASDPFGLGGDW